MATRERTRSSNSSRSSSSGQSAFSWKSGGGLVAAAAAGAALAIGANLGRKLAVQGLSASTGDWDESLAAEHEAVKLLFEKMLETENDATRMRKMMLMQLGHALDKHAYAEEHVVYALLREQGEGVTAKELENDHGAVKEYLYRLSKMAADDPMWLSTVAEFRDAVVTHAEEEEQEIFPALRASLSDEGNAQLTRDVNKAGFWAA